MLIKDLNKFRDEVISLYKKGYTICKIARQFDVYEAVISFMITSAGLSTKLGVISKVKEGERR